MNSWFKGMMGGISKPSRPVTPVKPAVKTTVRTQPRPVVQKPAPAPIPADVQEDSAQISNFGTAELPSGEASRTRPVLPVTDMSETGSDTPVRGSEKNSVSDTAESGKNLVTYTTESRQLRTYTEAKGEVLESIKTWAGKVETAPGSNVPLSDKLRRFVALLDDGRLLIAKSKEVSSEVLEAMQILKRQGKPVDNILIVELDVLRTVYINHEKNAPKNNSRRNRGDGLQEMQKQVLILIEKAALMGASDIHVKVGKHEAEVYIRADGIMQKQQLIEADIAQDICNAAFNMADASDATYKSGEYQGARISDIRTKLPEGVQSVRLQFNPLPNGGRYMICRLLYQNSKASTGTDIDTLGYTNIHIEQIKKMRRKPYGINIISGPTGSGKSTTLQRALTALMFEKRGTINVITIEDPPEYVIEGAAQLPVVNAKTDKERNEAFRQAISASLRSDPDIVMIGEIRDQSSANLAFAAAMTGHGVWASLHANDAISILDRFRNMEIDRHNLTDHTLVTGLISQRLVRKLCPHCSVPFNKACKEQLIDAELAGRITDMVGSERSKTVKASSGKSCEKGCKNGFTGREVVAETITPDAPFMAFILDNKKQDAYHYWLEKLNGLTMPEHALQKLAEGRISPQDMEEKFGDINDINKDRVEKVFTELHPSWQKKD